MRQTTAALTGTLLGAGLMYALDPARRRRRWALARDQLVHAQRVTRAAFDATARDATNRARGVVAEIRTLFEEPEDVPDDVLAERVRARLGQYVAHPHALTVEVTDGCVVLGGPVLVAEAAGLVNAVARVRGVRRVDNRLAPHQQADVPSLQGGAARRGPRPALLQVRWSPTARAAVGAAGVGLLVSGALRRSVVGSLVGAAGALLVQRAVSNRGLRDGGADPDRQPRPAHRGDKTAVGKPVGSTSASGTSAS